MILHDSLTVEYVGTSRTAFINIPIGRRIHYIGLEYGNTADAAFDAANNLGDIRVLINDNVQREHTAGELNDIQKCLRPHYAVRVINSATAGADRTIIPIFFADPGAKLYRDQQGAALTTNWMRSMRVEVDMGSQAGGSLSAFYAFDDVTSKDVPFITKIKRVDYDVNASIKDITNFDRSELYRQISFYNPTTGTITRVQVKHFGRDAYDLTRNQQAGVNQHLYDFNEAASILSDDLYTAGVFHIPFDGSGAVNDSMPGAGLEKIKLTFSAASTGYVRTLQQKVGLPD